MNLSRRALLVGMGAVATVASLPLRALGLGRLVVELGDLTWPETCMLLDTGAVPGVVSVPGWLPFQERDITEPLRVLNRLGWEIGRIQTLVPESDETWS